MSDEDNIIETNGSEPTTPSEPKPDVLLDDLKISSVVMPTQVEALNSAALVPPPAPVVQPVPQVEKPLVKSPILTIYPSKFVFGEVVFNAKYKGSGSRAKLKRQKVSSAVIGIDDVSYIKVSREKRNTVCLTFVAENTPYFNALGKCFALNRVEWSIRVSSGSLEQYGNALNTIGIDLLFNDIK